MSRLRLITAIALLLGCQQVARAEGNPHKKKPVPAQGEPGANSPQDCALVTAAAWSEGIGYKHVVTLQNKCGKAVICEVWTDVDPDTHYSLRAGPGQSDEVITRRGSPASGVTAGFKCKFE